MKTKTESPIRVLYVVTSGEYSDYGICAIFDNVKAAKKYCLDLKPEWGKHGCRIELFPLNPGKKYYGGRAPYFIVIRKDGQIISAQEDWGMKEGPRQRWPALGLDVTYNAWDDSLGMRIIAKSKKQAIKTANERRAQIVALNRWPRFKKTKAETAKEKRARNLRDKISQINREIDFSSPPPPSPPQDRP